LYCGNTKNKTQFLPVTQIPDIQLEMDPQLTTPTLIKGDLASLKSLRDGNMTECAYKIVEADQNLFKLNSPRKELFLERTDRDDLGFQHLTFAHQVNNVKIWGDELKMHFDKKGTLYHINGRYHPSLAEGFSTVPILNQSKATEIALADAKENINANLVKSIQLVILPQDSTFHLAYRLNLVGGAFDAINWDYFVNANDGSILLKADNRRR